MAQGGASGGPSLEGMARQFFEGWQRMLQPGAGMGAGGVAAGADGAAPAAMLEELMDRFGRGAAGFMDMASRFGGGQAPLSATPAELTAFWRDLVARAGSNPMLDALGSLEGAHARNLLDLGEAVERWAAPLLGQARGLLDRPAFGLMREHQQAQQRLARDLLDYREQAEAFRRLLQEVGEDAFRRFEGKLEAHSEPGRQLESLKALFDLWVDAAEEAWGEAALSDRFVETYGRLGNAAMRVRQGLQRQVAALASEFGLASRHDIDGGHRRLAELEREVRELRRKVAASPQTGKDPATPRGGGKPARPARTAKPSAPARATGASKASKPRKAARPSKASGAARADRKAKASAAVKPSKSPEAARRAKASGAAESVKASRASGASRVAKSSTASKSRAARAALQVPVPRGPASRGGR